jgi:hypothetical protein
MINATEILELFGGKGGSKIVNKKGHRTHSENIVKEVIGGESLQFQLALQHPFLELYKKRTLLRVYRQLPQLGLFLACPFD